MNDNILQSMTDDYGNRYCIRVCGHCGKPYRQEYEEQVEGFKMMDYDYCPYCKQVNGHSMSYEYNNYPLTDKEIENYKK